MTKKSDFTDTAHIVEWLINEKEIFIEFKDVISQAPDDIDWGSDTDFEIKWAALVKETEHKIRVKFPHASKDQQVEAVRLLAHKIHQH